MLTAVALFMDPPGSLASSISTGGNVGVVMFLVSYVALWLIEGAINRNRILNSADPGELKRLAAVLKSRHENPTVEGRLKALQEFLKAEGVFEEAVAPVIEPATQAASDGDYPLGRLRQLLPHSANWPPLAFIE